MYAEIAFPISSYQTFTYEIPAGLRERVQVGVRVKAPLGRRTVQGVVVGLSATTVFDGNIRAITALVDDLPVLDEKLWTLLKWVGRHYLTPLGQAARTALPKSLTSSYRPPTSQLVRFLSFGDEFATLQKRRPAQARLLQHLSAEHGAVPVAGLKELAADPTGLCKKLAAAGLVEITDEIRYPDATGFTFAPVHKEVVFSEEQNRIMQTLSVALEERRFHPALLHGVTGSGKTEIYIELVRQALAQGRTAILLLPEIALTPQIAGRFRSVFGETVALWHSKLSSAARSWTWRQLCAGQYSVVIGARSAIFTPLRNLGLIVVDEEQEHSYKQESPEPRYHARDVALMRGKLHAAVVLLASATPSLESYYNQIQSKLEYLHLSERFGGARYPRVHLVNMNQEQEETGKAGQVLSGMLLEKIADRLSKKEQIILLQNRRGYAPILRCGDCGEILNCPNCQISLTYHRHGDFLQCHFCGYTLQRVPDICPVCRGANLRLAGTGTQKVEDVLAEAFPAARLVRLDLDTTRSGTVLTRALEDFGRGRHDILLGTQMIAKGLDFGNATLVGIINADTGLFLPDFRAGERVFQLIYQAAGRAGRHQKPGEVVVQTYNPDDPVIKHAARLDLQQYYNIALSERRELNYSPFSWMVRVEFSGILRERVEACAREQLQLLHKGYAGLEILGPAPCYREKLRNQYRFQLVLKSVKTKDPNGSKLHRYLAENFPESRQNKFAGGVRMAIDIDPLSLL